VVSRLLAVINFLARIVLHNVDLEITGRRMKNDTFRSAFVRFLRRGSSRTIKTLQSVSAAD